MQQTVPNEYWLDAMPTCSAAFTRPNGNPVDPTTVTFKMREPGQAVAQATVYVFGVDAQLIRDGVGLYHVDWQTTLVGDHCYQFQGTGDAVAIEQKTFTVIEGCFAPA